MASAKGSKTKVAVELPECPVCMETFSKPIYQCQTGHSLCNICISTLSPPFCPICRKPMTQMRNWNLEEIIDKAKVPCPNKPDGCIYTMMNQELESHLMECIFRKMDCPLGVIFGRCSWSGKVQNMLAHFKERHPENCNVSTDSEVELSNINLHEDDRQVFIVAQAKLLFILTFKIDTSQKIAYWTIQHIGSKNVARQHIYEIHVASRQDDRRKSVFIEHCFNDNIKADEVFRQGKCAVMPLKSLNHFVKDNKIAFRFFIKRLPSPPKKGDNEDGKKENHPKNKGPGPKGPHPNQGGPKGPKNANCRVTS